jgi:serine/threonine protein kinase/regulator of sirC expression with transglutaminase-like and TPR domain
MKSVQPGQLADDASSPQLALVVRKYEADWRSSTRYRPDPRDYLCDAGEDRRAALLALLRADLVLSHRFAEARPVEWYMSRYPELDAESLLALIYEEFCLREEAGESPTAAEYQTRFPDVAASFQEVIEIHDLVGRAGERSWRAPRDPGPPFPDAGQTIAGFQLVEELGRGAFARVYLAEEKHLADRPVALKVSRTGSREPETLARLQHTHIVPVYSSRSDPLTGLHLLCMPYLGSVTLLQVLHHPAIRSAKSGSDILTILDNLERPAGLVQEASSRAALRRLSYPRAIAWWGARMAEALEHAHERGVLHRDVKPSNVLVTSDGLPKLVDFNLARTIALDEPDADVTVGGTLAYMAPERLLALAEGRTDHVDARSDIYALGVVLFDCLVRVTGAFALPSTRSTLTESLLTAAKARSAAPVRLRVDHPEVPRALEAVVNRCLAPEPVDRYARAADLAADLQAVADDAPLLYAQEPISSQLGRWLRRNRRRLAVALPLLLALGVTAYTLFRAERAAASLRSEVSHAIDEGRRAAERGRFDLATSDFNTALRLADGNARLREFRETAAREKRIAEETKEVCERADALFADADRLRFLLRFGHDSSAYRSVQTALARFAVPTDPNWSSSAPLQLLDQPRRARLLSEVNDLVFLWVWALLTEAPDNAPVAREALQLCDRALQFASPKGPWQAMRNRAIAAVQGEAPRLQLPTLPSQESSARGSFQWALLFELDGQRALALAWLQRAAALREDDYWYWTCLGEYHYRDEQVGRALADYNAAIALRPELPYARYNRALVYFRRGELHLALDDLKRAFADAHGADFLDLRLTLGRVEQALGDESSARAAYEAVIAAGPGSVPARAARLNRASLDWYAGFPDRAWAEYNSLLDEDPRDVLARRNRALLGLQTGRIEQADSDLTLLLRDDPEHADLILARRTVARLALGRLRNAEADAAGAYRRKPTATRERLWIRTLLASRRAEDLLWITQPDDLALLPAGGTTLQDDLRVTIERLTSLANARNSSRIPPTLLYRTRAVLQSALGASAAIDSANQAIAFAPDSVDAFLVRARIRRRKHDQKTALTDVESGLALAPLDPRLLELRGMLKSELGNPQSGLLDIDNAIARGAPRRARQSRAVVLSALGRNEEAVREWTAALEDDAEDPEAYLGRAIALLRLGLHDQALVDLGSAGDWASDNPHLLSRITFNYASCLGSHPERFRRWFSLLQRTWSAWCATARSSTHSRTGPLKISG